MFFGFCFIDRGFMTAPEFRLLNFLPRTGWLSGVFWQQRLPDSVSAYPFFFLRRKKNLKKKELQGGCPLDPRLRWRHHNRMGKQWENSVQVAQRGQVRARTVKHSAANTETFSAVHNISVVWLPGLPVPWGVSGGGAALSPGF